MQSLDSWRSVIGIRRHGFGIEVEPFNCFERRRVDAHVPSGRPAWRQREEGREILPRRVLETDGGEGRAIRRGGEDSVPAPVALVAFQDHHHPYRWPKW